MENVVLTMEVFIHTEICNALTYKENVLGVGIEVFLRRDNAIL